MKQMKLDDYFTPLITNESPTSNSGILNFLIYDHLVFHIVVNFLDLTSLCRVRMLDKEVESFVSEWMYRWVVWSFRWNYNNKCK